MYVAPYIYMWNPQVARGDDGSSLVVGPSIIDRAPIVYVGGVVVRFSSNDRALSHVIV